MTLWRRVSSSELGISCKASSTKPRSLVVSAKHNDEGLPGVLGEQGNMSLFLGNKGKKFDNFEFEDVLI